MLNGFSAVNTRKKVLTDNVLKIFEIILRFFAVAVGLSEWSRLLGSPAENDFTKVWSHAKMCVVEVPFKLYCTVNVCSKFTASKTGEIPVNGKQYDTKGIPENLLHLLIPFV